MIKKGGKQVFVASNKVSVAGNKDLVAGNEDLVASNRSYFSGKHFANNSHKTAIANERIFTAGNKNIQLKVLLIIK